MLTREQKSSLRDTLFRHLDGIAVAPTAYALHEKGVLDYLVEHKEISLTDISDHFSANEGYMNVALRLLASQGWLEMAIDNDSISYHINDKSAKVFKLVPLYKDVVDLIKFTERFHRRKFEQAPFLLWEKIARRYLNHFELKSWDNRKSLAYQVLKHIEGILVGPTVVALGMGGMFHKYFMDTSFRPDEFHADGDAFERLLNFFVELGWFTRKNGTFSFKEEGLFYARRASAYGVTVSYIPMFRHLDDMIFGKADLLRNVAVGEREKHVDREMNVWGSGGAHSAYFKKMDEVIREIFNKPLDEQPAGMLDMGCGNGAFLIHAFEVIEGQTLRGQHLEDHPLFLVGADFNEAALKVTRANLINADIWAKVIWGDIGRPDLLADKLKEDYGIELRDLLNVRTFLDHNRIWTDPTNDKELNVSDSTGAFSHRGTRIPNHNVEQNLKEHFQKWQPYVDHHGLLLIELHTISPQLAAENIGRTAVTAYDGTHGFSDQYIVELDVFLKVLEEVGLHQDERFSHKFPNSELATVSINLFKGH
ncbi:MAG: class I SAM-dependent methyltransferase [Saprospiraceae bacterium]|nr:class I SAM-dependent methyltransferase [Saprospiraceae bacterium]